MYDVQYNPPALALNKMKINHCSLRNRGTQGQQRAVLPRWGRNFEDEIRQLIMLRLQAAKQSLVKSELLNESTSSIDMYKYN